MSNKSVLKPIAARGMENLPYVAQLVTSGFGSGTLYLVPEDQPWGDSVPGWGALVVQEGDIENSHDVL